MRLCTDSFPHVFMLACRVWSLETGCMQRVINAHKGTVRSLAICNDNETCVSCGDDFLIKCVVFLIKCVVFLIKCVVFLIKCVVFLIKCVVFLLACNIEASCRPAITHPMAHQACLSIGNKRMPALQLWHRKQHCDHQG